MLSESCVQYFDRRASRGGGPSLLAPTQKCRGRDGAVAAGHHHANASFHEGNGEIDDLRALLIDRQRAHGHDGFLIHHLQRERQRRLDKGSELYTPNTCTLAHWLNHTRWGGGEGEGGCCPALIYYHFVRPGPTALAAAHTNGINGESFRHLHNRSLSAAITGQTRLQLSISSSPDCMSLDCGRKPEHLEETHTDTGSTYKLHQDPGHPSRESTLGPLLPPNQVNLRQTNKALRIQSNGSKFSLFRKLSWAMVALTSPTMPFHTLLIFFPCFPLVTR